jgi:hypothetical protein
MQKATEVHLPKHFVVSDGEIVLFLWPAEEGGYAITSPLDDRLISQAENMEEAFEMGHDALKLLREYDRESSRDTPRKNAVRSAAARAAAGHAASKRRRRSRSTRAS